MESKIVPCGMCLNARVNDDLTDRNDLSYSGVGEFADGYRMFVASGGGKPLRLEIERLTERGWALIGYWYPKHCPNCGREIAEYGGRRNAK